jgi:hypothetical protein
LLSLEEAFLLPCGAFTVLGQQEGGAPP